MSAEASFTQQDNADYQEHRHVDYRVRYRPKIAGSDNLVFRNHCADRLAVAVDVGRASSHLHHRKRYDERRNSRLRNHETVKQSECCTDKDRRCNCTGNAEAAVNYESCGESSRNCED